MALSPLEKPADEWFMMFPFIRSYSPGMPVPPHSFFLLSKGENSGFPRLEPWTNSFMLTCGRASDFEFYYWLCMGIWRAGRFRIRQRGSVIPCIRIADVHELLREVAPLIRRRWEEYKKLVSLLDKLEKVTYTFSEQLDAMKSTQRQLISEFLKGRK
ncbi:MAG: hypothetical protein JST39_09095 [Bacteroidetes bacterium]|nr:hypothetical protein [Bacteroidota bacterium]